MTASFSQRVVEAAAGRLARFGISRRSFLVRTAVIGSALAVTPKRFLFEPGTAYASVTSVCGPGTTCSSGYTVFCCSINNGVNKCPPGTFPGGWWRAGTASSWCCGGDRYYIDCNSQCTKCNCGSGGTICADSCQSCSHYCNPGPTCDQRRVCVNRFRYGQCNQQIGCSGNVACRTVSCTPPWLNGDLNCTSTDHADPSTAEHGAPCLQQPLPGPHFVGPLPIGGVLASSPAIAEVKGTGRSDVFVIGIFADGTYGQIWWATFQNGWMGWFPLGAPPPGVMPGSNPAAVSWAAGRLDVFVWGVDNKLWQRYSTDGGQTWSGWLKPVPEGTLSSSPAVCSWGPGRIDVFVVGTDNALWHAWYDKAWTLGWEQRGSPPGGIGPKEVTAVSWGVGRVDAFVTGSDRRLWQTYYSRAWSGWLQPRGTEIGTLTSGPAAASWSSGHIAVFTRGTDNALWWTNFFQDYWSSWARLGLPGSVFVGAPGAASLGCQKLDVLVRGTDNACVQYSFTG